MPAPLEIGHEQGSMAIPEAEPWYSQPWFRVLHMASVGISTFHGYRRTKTIRWAIGWGLLGGIFPVIVPSIAFAQGLGKPKG